MNFFVGLPTKASDFYEKGVEPVLDYLKDTVHVSAVFIQARTYYGESGYHARDEYYAFTKLRDRPSELMKKGFDILGELTDRSHERGMEVYSHFLSYDFIHPMSESAVAEQVDEHGFIQVPNAQLRNLSHVLEIDQFGRKSHRPCLLNPEYRAYHCAVVEDQLRGYPIDGVIFNTERNGPLTGVLIGSGVSTMGRKPYAGTCFCPYCLEEAHRRGIDASKAKEGFLRLLEFSERSWLAALKNKDPFAIPGMALTDIRDTSPPPEGYFVEFLRIISRFPEVLAWNQMWYDNMLSLFAEVYGTAKAVSPSRKVGFHVWHPRAFNPFMRALFNVREMRRYCDWIKPKMDHTCGGYRFYRYIQRIHQALFYDRTLEQAARAVNAVFDWDVDFNEFSRLPEQGLGLDYLEKDTRAYIAEVDDAVPIYPGIGIDMPSGPESHKYRPCEPQYVYDGLMTIAKAGARGTVLCRDLCEMQEKNMEAAGKAIAEIQRVYQYD
ncbi:MAG: hypothetical protein LBS62_03895 [Clostridiales bacterium]|jgi:hypothetical protein|nr:hypothetical protein [Clostridiales bacterium]